MAKNKFLKSLAVIGPPIALVVIGIGIYIFVVKLISPDLKTISAIPNKQQSLESSTSASPSASTSATPINPITTQVMMADDDELGLWQSETDNGEHEWRLDPISAAEQQAGIYGFLPGDQLTLVTSDQNQAPSKTATILAIHGADTYLITMIQPKKTGREGIWVIQNIEKQS